MTPMPDEPSAAPPDLRKCGLWGTVTKGGELNVGAWLRADAEAAIVGTCRRCGGYIVPDSPPHGDETAIRWFEAKCLSCGHVVASPGGRLARRTGPTAPPRTRR